MDPMSAATSMAHVILNPGSGAGNKAVLTRAIETAFTAQGWQVEFVGVGRHNMHTRARRTVAQAPGTLVVAGGDGTINAVASACVEANRPLGIVPAGTFNYIARHLGLPTEVAPAVSAIINGHVRRVDMGEINGRMFLNNAGLGLYARLIEQRERDKRRFGRRRLVAFVSGVRTLLRPSPLYTVDLVADGRPERRRTTTLFFGCNALQLEDFHLAAAECIQHQQFAVLTLALHNRWEIAMAACMALIGVVHSM
jgi:diacylglycerol kinase family enzyme